MEASQKIVSTVRYICDQQHQQVTIHQGQLGAIVALGEEVLHLVRHLRHVRVLLLAQQDVAVLVPLCVHGPTLVHVELPRDRLVGRKGLKVARHLLQELYICVGVSAAQDLHRAVVLAAVQLGADVGPQGLPAGPAHDLHHVHLDGVEDGHAEGLQGYGDGLFFCSDVRVFGLLDRGQHGVDLGGLNLPVFVHVDALLEEEGQPLRPPLLQRAQVALVAVDHSGAHDRAAVADVDRVGDAVRHRGQPLLPQQRVLHKARDDLALAEVGLPVLSGLVHPLPAHLGHLQCELLEHLVSEYALHLHIQHARVLDESGHILHKLIVLGVVVGDPVLEGVVVDGCDVPRDGSDKFAFLSALSVIHQSRGCGVLGELHRHQSGEEEYET
mmetsp:Transcript_31169/g.68750  ORF Transcript_31169/g.68750 Transcript_31169/m.68750 type:complete len:383 (-) Transcript_31169:159-1307(-)